MPRMTLQQALDLAASHQQAGRLEEAESLCRQILSHQPDCAPALQIRGMLAQQQGRGEEAVQLLARAIELNPASAEARGNLGLVLAAQGQTEQAIEVLRTALDLRPDLPETHNNLGNLLHKQGRLADAIASFRRAMELRPNWPGAQYNLGVALLEAGQVEDAITELEQAAAFLPEHPEVHFRLGKSLQQAGRKEEASVAFRRAIALRPEFADSHTELGIVLQELGALPEAVVAFRQALAHRPGVASAHYNLAGALRDAGEVAEAIAEYQIAIALKPDFAEAFHNLGNVYHAQGLLEAAVQSYQQAIALRPGFADALFSLGNTSRDAGLLDEAIDAFRRVLALNPDYAYAFNNLANALKDAGRLDEAIAAYRRAVELRPEAWIHSNLVYTLHFHPSYDRPRLFEEHARWNEMHARPLSSRVAPQVSNRKSKGRLRIGYVSAHFTDHPVGRFLLPILQHHDRDAFEVYCYSSVVRPTAATARYKASADTWRDVARLGDEQLATLIREDHVDVLIDLGMHMEGSRLLAFARKPAPVQITYLAYCSTTGLDTMDYRLTDPWLDPPGTDESCYSERSIRLPRTYWCYQASESAPAVGPLPGGVAGYVTFGCLNNYCKVTEPTWSTWADLLSSVPGSRLIVHAPQGGHRQRAADFLARRGIDPARLEFVGLLALEDYLRLHQRIDIGLDPFPYPGGTTTCDALWMGVPVISLAGQTAVSRAGLSILSNVGLPELVAQTTDDYLRIAKDLAGDFPRLSHLRSTLRDRMKSSPLMDAVTFTRDLEAAYQRAVFNAG